MYVIKQKYVYCNNIWYIYIYIYMYIDQIYIYIYILHTHSGKLRVLAGKSKLSIKHILWDNQG